MRPNLDLPDHKLAAAVATKVVEEDVADSVADLAAAWVLAAEVLVEVVVKSTSPTFVTSILSVTLVESAELTLPSSFLIPWDGRI